MNILGIDIGTTSIKIAIYDFANKQITEPSTRDTNSTITSNDLYRHEQNVDKILQTIDEMLDEVETRLLQSVGHVGISGQMHGIMFWNESENLFRRHSNFITWMDQRCNQNNFVISLPKMPSNIVEKMSISSGYGCGTIFHLMDSDEEFINQWKYAGNIVDFFASTLCGSDVPLMTPHMAHSWGYFDIIGNKWFTDILDEHNFPTRLLPSIVAPGTVVGRCKGLTKIPANALVYAGMGDLQCSMYRALAHNLNAAINISTSAQFAVRATLSELHNLSDSFSNDILNLPPGLVINPYFNSGDFLLVAASLNGGNVMSSWVSMLQQWIGDVCGVETPVDKIWCHLTSSYKGSVSERVDEIIAPDSLVIRPILFGERYCPTAGASISNIFPYNCNLANIYRSLCYGLVKNLTNLFPLEIVSKLSVNHLQCSGGATRRHRCLEDSIRQIYGVAIADIEFTKTYDACVGAIDYLMTVINN